jgi:hypothetical protein
MHTELHIITYKEDKEYFLLLENYTSISHRVEYLVQPIGAKATGAIVLGFPPRRRHSLGLPTSIY